jgi:ABC-2 type transport system permease protein
VLLTLPFRESTLVAGKFLAAFILLAIMVVLTLPMPLLLARFGTFDWGEVAGQYIGALLLGAAGISVGLFISSLTTNQISAFLISVFVLVIFTLISWVNRAFPLPNLLAGVLNYVALGAHFSNFQKGLIDTRDLLFYLIVCGLFLYLNMKTLVFRKW